jgi:hypothetical protein
VGTTTGEVMRASLVEGLVPAKTPTEETAVARPATSEQEALRKELEEIRSAFDAKAVELQTRTEERDELRAGPSSKACTAFRPTSTASAGIFRRSKRRFPSRT